MKNRTSGRIVRHPVVLSSAFLFFALVGVDLDLSQPLHAIESASGGDSPFVNAVRRATPAVVSITARKAAGVDLHRYYLLKPFWALSQGSGVLIDKDGYILTNDHIVRDARDIRVVLSDSREFSAEIIGRDPDTDVALIKLKIEGKLDERLIAELGDSDAVKVGDWAIAIGNPLGFGGTVSTGVISSKGRRLDVIEGGTPLYQSFIQTDASINPGNSGGPLINIRGQVIGINAAYNSGWPGIGFAIPINLAIKAAQELREKGVVVRGFLGIRPQEITRDIAEAKRLPSTDGVLVSQVWKDTPAERSGIRVGDVIIKLDGERIDSLGQFTMMIADRDPGEKIEVSVIRDGKEEILTFELGERPKPSSSAEDDLREDDQGEWMGMEVENVDSPAAKAMGIDDQEGVVVTYVQPGGPAAAKGIRRGDVILEVEGQRIRDIKDYLYIAERLKGSEKAILFLRKRGGATEFVALKANRNKGK